MIAKLSNGLKQSLLYGSSIALMKGVSLLMLPFIANHLSTEEFGRLEVISTIAIIGSILVGMGLDNTLFRFAGAAKTTQQRNKIAADIFSLTLIIGFSFGIAAWVSSEFIAAWLPGNTSEYEIRLVLFMLALEGCISIPLGWLRMNNRAISFFFASTGRALTHSILVVIQLSLGNGVEGILEAGLIAAVLQTLVLSYLHIKDTGLSISLQTGKQSFIYSLPIVGSGLVAFALNGLDRWILVEHTSLTDVAEFGVAAKFALAMVLMMQPFSMWWSPRRFKILQDINGREEVTRYISLGMILALIIAVFVGLASPLLINWLLPDTYINAGQYAVGLALVMLLRELVELFNIGCFTGKTTFTQLVINSIGAVTGVVCMIWLTPIYAVWGIITSLLIAQAIRLTLFYIASQHFLPLPYPVSPLLILLISSMSTLFIGTQINSAVLILFLMIISSSLLLLTAHLFKLIPLPLILAKDAS